MSIRKFSKKSHLLNFIQFFKNQSQAFVLLFFKANRDKVKFE